MALTNSGSGEMQLDRRYFALDEESFAAFVQMLNAPPEPNAKLRELFRRLLAWASQTAEEL